MSIAYLWRQLLRRRRNYATEPNFQHRRTSRDATLKVESLETRLVPAVSLVKDINPGLPSSLPHSGINADGTLFFVANDGVHGLELWKSDGSTGGTVLAADINPTGSSNPQGLTSLNGNVFFSADDGVHGRELWMYDAATQTATMVADINPGGDSDPQNFAAFGSQVLFSADDGVHGRELWTSDGTIDNTQMVSDINPGPASSSPADLTFFNNAVYFSADDGVHGRELWVSDGTEDNTVMVDDIVPGSASGNPNQLTPVGSTLYFVATTPAAGTELWQSDGGSQTQLTKDILPGAASSNPTDLTNINDTSVFFAADDGVHGREIWKSDSLSNTASLITDINPGTNGSNPAGIVDQFGTALFVADDGVHGAQLWRADGVPADTALVTLINPNGDAFERLAGNRFVVPEVLSNGLLVFAANDGVHGFEPWISDGTASGTFMVQDLNPGAASSAPSELTDIFGSAYFSANDGSTGFELHSLDAIPRTFLSIDLDASPPTSNAGQPVTLTVSPSTPIDPSQPQPTGTVLFTDGGSTIYGTADFVGGVAVLTTTNLPVGFNLVVANYQGDSNYSPADNFALVEVDAGAAADTTTALSVDKNPSTQGQQVTFTATVTSETTASGTVEFMDGANSLGTRTLDASGVAKLSLSNLTPGAHTITAVFQGSADFVSSRDSVTQTVNRTAASTTTTTVSGDPNPSTNNQSVTITATVSSGSGIPTGFVEFLTGSTSLGVAEIDAAGKAVLTLSTLPSGQMSITATYGASPQLLSSSGSYTQQVGQPAAVTATTVSGDPNPSTVGQTVTFTATVTSASAIPTGSVHFTEGNADLGTVALDVTGHAALPVSGLTVGPHTITATFLGNASFAPSSNTTNQVVNPAPAITSTSVSGDPNPSTVGQTVTFTATVTSASAIPTGSVHFTEGNADLGTVALDAAGQAALAVSSLTVGPHTITATFLGNASFAASSNTTTQQVNNPAPAATSTTVAGNPNPSTVGQTVTFTATVTSASAIPTGSVHFTEGNTDLGTVALDVTGHAALPVSSLTVGSHTITATFLGNASFAASSNTTTQQVNNPAPAATSTTVAGNPNPSTLGQTVTFTATVTSASAIPTGSVHFTEGNTDLGTVALDVTGHAALPVSSLTVGSHTVTATFLGNASFASSSNTATQQVNNPAPVATSTTVAGNPNPSTLGQTVTFTATVTSASATPTGSVHFTEGNTDLGTVALDVTGHAALPASSLTVGPHTITATFLGNASFASSSNTATQQVNNPAPVATSTTVTGNPNPSTFGQTVTFTVTVTSTSATPTGSVHFTEGNTDLGTVALDVTGHASLPVSSLTVGPHTITATFLGNASFASSFNTTTQQVNNPVPVATSTTVTGNPNPAALGQTVLFTAVVSSASGTPTGSVTFKEGTTNLGTVSLDATGRAALQVSSLTLGTHTITASYLGAASFLPSSNTTSQQIVTGIATAISVTGSPSPSFTGQPVTLSITVTADSGTPSGPVHITDGATDLGNVVLDKTGHASLLLASLGIGAHTISVTYPGSAGFLGSSTSVGQTVNPPPASTSTTLAISPVQAVLGQPVTFTAQVTSAAGIPTGQVNFSEGTTDFGTASVDASGKVSLQISSLSIGAHNITATFVASASFFGSGFTAPVVVAASTVVPTSNTDYVTRLYHDLLQREPDSLGLASWVQQVDSGVNRAIVAYNIEQSAERRALVVNAVYEATLVRAPDPLGFANSMILLQSGQTARQLQAFLQASPEYFFRRAGGTQLGFLNGIYLDSLGRLPDASAQTLLLPLLNLGYSHLQLATQVATSVEADSRFIETVYRQFLGRSVDAPSLQSWIDFMVRGGKDDQVVAGILGSDEYFHQAMKM